jgi:hypothetical protein
MIWSVDPERFGLLTFNHGPSDHYLRLGIRLRTGTRPEDMFPTDEFIEAWHGFYRRALSEGSYTIEYPGIAGRSILQ